MGKKSPRQLAKDKAWKEFSRYIRVKFSNSLGECECVTCGKVSHYKELQAGHFIDSRCNAVLFREDLVYPQCPGCNLFKHGNYVQYTLFMLKKHTQEEIEEFANLKHKTLKYTIDDFKELADMYKGKTERLILEKEIEKEISF